MKYALKEIEIDKLKLHPQYGALLYGVNNNPDVSILENLFAENGYLPINQIMCICIKKGGNVFLVSGGKAWLALRKLGIKKITTLCIECADEVLLKKIMIMENLQFTRCSYLQR